MRLAYYLFKKSVTTFDCIWRDEGGPGASYEPVVLTGTPFEAVAYLQANRPVEPPWWSYVEPYCSVPSSSRPVKEVAHGCWP